MSSGVSPSRQAATRVKTRCFICERGKGRLTSNLGETLYAEHVPPRIKIIRGVIPVQHDSVAGFEGNLDGRFAKHSVLKTSHNCMSGLKKSRGFTRLKDDSRWMAGRAEFERALRLSGADLNRRAPRVGNRKPTNSPKSVVRLDLTDPSLSISVPIRSKRWSF